MNTNNKKTERNTSAGAAGRNASTGAFKKNASAGSSSGNKDKAGVRKHRKIQFDKPGNILYPVPAALVSCCDKEGRANLITIAWTGTVCSEPPMVSISVRKSRFSHKLISETGEFVINLTTEELAAVTDTCGVRSGRDVDKFKAYGLTPCESKTVRAPGVLESPVNIECKVIKTLELGSHDMFIAEVTCVQADEEYMDKNGRFHLEKAGLIAYSHGSYFALGRQLGTFGFSVRKKK